MADTTELSFLRGPIRPTQVSIRTKFIVEGLSPLQQSPLSFAVIIDCSGLRSSRYEIKTMRTSLIFSI